MGLQRSALRYYCMATQSAQGSPASAPAIQVPAVKSQSKFKTNMNIQDEKYSTGDLFILVDGIPVKPTTSGVLVMPFKPHVLNSVLAACCYANGDLIKPVWTTWWIGDGYNEKIYSDVLFSSGEMLVDDSSGPALWTLNFMGLNIPTPHAVVDYTSILPAYERSFRMKDLQPMTILSNVAKNNIESLRWMIASGASAYFGSRGDGTDGPSTIVVNELSAGMEITMGSEDDEVRAAYTEACGAPGDFIATLVSDCTDTTYTHSLELDNGLIYDDEQNAPDDLPINEPFTVKGLRSAASGHPSPAKIVISAVAD